MNDLALYAYGALDKALERQSRQTPPHEIADCGPPWSCGEFGRPGHDYYTCPLCQANFQRWLGRKETTR